MTDSTRFDLNPQYSVEKFDDEILLYGVSTEKGIYLNETAYLIWEMCSRELSTGEMITLLEQTYPAQKGLIREDVLTTLESLLKTGALLRRDD